MTARSALVAVMLVGLSCGGRSTDEPPAPLARSLVHVINNNTLTMHMYAIVGPQMASLGVVSSFSRETYELPTSAVARGEVRILADPIGSRVGYVTDRIVFSPGDEIEVKLENNLAISSYSVW